MDFAVNSAGEVVVQKFGVRRTRKPDRFELARGKADIRWTTGELMTLLRAPD